MTFDENLFDDLDEYIAAREKREPGFAARVEAKAQRRLAAQIETTHADNHSTQELNGSENADVPTSQPSSSRSI